MQIDVDVSGFDTVGEQIEEFIEETHNAVEEELDNTAKMIKDEAQRIAPVDTGTLRDAYKYSASGFKATIFNLTDYAWRIEEGFHGTDSLGRTYNQPGQHILRRAFNKGISKFSDRLQIRVENINL